jgi:hypothetical protein
VAPISRASTSTTRFHSTTPDSLGTRWVEEPCTVLHCKGIKHTVLRRCRI